MFETIEFCESVYGPTDEEARDDHVKRFGHWIHQCRMLKTSEHDVHKCHCGFTWS